MLEEAPSIYKKWEFKQFLTLLEGKELGRALIYAKALGIDRRTMQKWMEQPEVSKPLIDALDKLLDDMRIAGKSDWRMHREMIKILGLDDGDTIKLADADGDIFRPITVEIINAANNNPDTSRVQ